MRKIYILLFLILGLVVVFFLGPKKKYEPITIETTRIDLSLDNVESYLKDQEAQIANIKPENTANIVWANDSIQKTPYSIVYLHGFSASGMEGNPSHKLLAKRYGFNLYLPRLAEHGINEEEALLEVTPDKLIDSAKEAIEIGRIIGGKVIVMSCSTGGTLGIYLSANLPELADVHLLYSPNISVKDSRAKLLSGPWGLEIARTIRGENYNRLDLSPNGDKYWTAKYRLEAVVALQNLLDETMTSETFKKFNTPFFMGYYYESPEKCDNIVSVDAMLDFYEQAGTPENLKRQKAFANARHHVVLSDLRTPNYTDVLQETYHFLEEVIGLKPIRAKI